MNTALAIFAKTIGLSPVKTRLAASIGKSLAEDFYTLSVNAIIDITTQVQKNSNNKITPYWALAEEEGVQHPNWQNFQSLWTDDGNLGDRLHNIYSTLQKTHDAVMLMGTDSPQLSPDLISSAISKLNEHPDSCVLGPCFDGGFYLFASKVPIPENIWNSVTYSQDTTLQELVGKLTRQEIPVYLLKQHGDIDVVTDLQTLTNSLDRDPNLLPAQQKLYTWLKEHKIYMA